MTGHELLREELKKRGFTANQIDSKVVGGVLDVVAQNPNTTFADIQEAEQELVKLRSEFERKKGIYERELERIRIEKQSIIKSVMEKEQYINDWLEKLSECETAEGRDRMRIAQMFVNSVNVDSKYDNTAFITGLAAILTGGKIGALEEMKKINPIIFGRI